MQAAVQVANLVRRVESEVSLASLRAVSELGTIDAGPAGGRDPVAGSFVLRVRINTSAPPDDIHAPRCI
jgi:hypothetical protein